MNLKETYQRLFKSRPSSNDALLLESSRKLLTENTKMKKFFIDLLTTAQAQGKFEDVVKFLDDEYGVWFTDDAKITPQALQSKINRSDFSAMSSSDIKDIEKEVKNILK